MSLKNLQELTSGFDKLSKLLHDYAVNNRAKNAATRAETAAKKKLLAEMLKEKIVSYDETVEIGEQVLSFRAEIGDIEETFIDPELLFKYLNKDMKKFMSFVYISKESIKNEFGDTAVIALSSTRIKKDAFTIKAN